MREERPGAETTGARAGMKFRRGQWGARRHRCPEAMHVRHRSLALLLLGEWARGGASGVSHLAQIWPLSPRGPYTPFCRVMSGVNGRWH